MLLRYLVGLVLFGATTFQMGAPDSAVVTSGQNWSSTEVDAGAYFVSMAFDVDDQPRMAYTWPWPQIQYASRAGNAWHVDYVTRGDYPSLALASDGRPYISFYASGLALAVLSGTVWTTQTIDAGNLVGVYTSLRLDKDGHPRISYANRNTGQLKYAAFDGSSWSTATVDGGLSSYFEHSSIALDSNGNPGIAYFSNGDLKYALFNGATWAIVTVDSDGTTGRFCSLAFDAENRPHISYVSSTTGKLRYARNDGLIWQKVDIADGSYTSLALDRGDHPHIASWTPSNNTVTHSWNDGLNWHSEPVGSAGSSSYENWRFSIAVDSAGRSGIAYWGSGISLTLATRGSMADSAALIESGGGMLRFSDGATIEFPSGSLSATVVITASPASIVPPDNWVATRHAYSLTAVYSGTSEAAELTPGRAFTFTVNFNRSTTGVAARDTLAFFYQNGSEWIREMSSEVDPGQGKALATPSHLSIWALLGETRRALLPLVFRAPLQ